jgi:3-oxoadipate enol-lactonase
MVAGYRGEDLLSPPSAPGVDVVQCLAGRPLPALIITGEHEVGSRKAHAARLRELLPASEAACVEGAGHLCNLSHPARYNALVLEFCARVERG